MMSNLTVINVITRNPETTSDLLPSKLSPSQLDDSRVLSPTTHLKAQGSKTPESKSKLSIQLPDFTTSGKVNFHEAACDPYSRSRRSSSAAPSVRSTRTRSLAPAVHNAAVREDSFNINDMLSPRHESPTTPMSVHNDDETNDSEDVIQQLKNEFAMLKLINSNSFKTFNHKDRGCDIHWSEISFSPEQYVESSPCLADMNTREIAAVSPFVGNQRALITVPQPIKKSVIIGCGTFGTVIRARWLPTKRETAAISTSAHAAVSTLSPLFSSPAASDAYTSAGVSQLSTHAASTPHGSAMNTPRGAATQEEFIDVAIKILTLSPHNSIANTSSPAHSEIEYELLRHRVRKEASIMTLVKNKIQSTDHIVDSFGVIEGAIPDNIATLLNVPKGELGLCIVTRYEGGGSLQNYLRPRSKESASTVASPGGHIQLNSTSNNNSNNNIINNPSSSSSSSSSAIGRVNSGNSVSSAGSNQRSNKLSMSERLRLLLHISIGIFELHANGIVHADLKPENILLSSDTPPQIRLADFGLSLVRDSPPESPSNKRTSPQRNVDKLSAPSSSSSSSSFINIADAVALYGRDEGSAGIHLGGIDAQSFRQLQASLVHKTSRTRGTMAYCAPEMLVNPYLTTMNVNELGRVAKPSRRTDMYAFALIAWQVLSLRRPFTEIKGEVMLSSKVHQGYRPPIDKLPKDTPEEIVRMIESCWHADRMKRLTAGECVKIISKAYKRHQRQLSASSPIATGGASSWQAPSNSGSSGSSSFPFSLVVPLPSYDRPKAMSSAPTPIPGSLSPRDGGGVMGDDASVVTDASPPQLLAKSTLLNLDYNSLRKSLTFTSLRKSMTNSLDSFKDKVVGNGTGGAGVSISSQGRMYSQNSAYDDAHPDYATIYSRLSDLDEDNSSVWSASASVPSSPNGTYRRTVLGLLEDDQSESMYPPTASGRHRGASSGSSSQGGGSYHSHSTRDDTNNSLRSAKHRVATPPSSSSAAARVENPLRLSTIEASLLHSTGSQFPPSLNFAISARSASNTQNFQSSSRPYREAQSPKSSIIRLDSGGSIGSGGSSSKYKRRLPPAIPTPTDIASARTRSPSHTSSIPSISTKPGTFVVVSPLHQKRPSPVGIEPLPARLTRTMAESRHLDIDISEDSVDYVPNLDSSKSAAPRSRNPLERSPALDGLRRRNQGTSSSKKTEREEGSSVIPPCRVVTFTIISSSSYRTHSKSKSKHSRTRKIDPPSAIIFVPKTLSLSPPISSSSRPLPSPALPSPALEPPQLAAVNVTTPRTDPEKVSSTKSSPFSSFSKRIFSSSKASPTTTPIPHSDDSTGANSNKGGSSDKDNRVPSTSTIGTPNSRDRAEVREDKTSRNVSPALSRDGKGPDTSPMNTFPLKALLHMSTDLILNSFRREPSVDKSPPGVDGASPGAMIRRKSLATTDSDRSHESRNSVDLDTSADGREVLDPLVNGSDANHSMKISPLVVARSLEESG